MKKIVFMLVLCAMISASCTSEKETIGVKSVNLIETKPVYPTITRVDAFEDFCLDGYYCTSEMSPLQSEIYPNEDNTEAYAYIVDDEQNSLSMLKFVINSFESPGVCTFTTYNENNEPILYGIYDSVNCYTEITDINPDFLEGRISVAAWGCNLAIGIVGGIWSTAAGMVSAGAGFVVGLSYTVMAIGFCSGL